MGPDVVGLRSAGDMVQPSPTMRQVTGRRRRWRPGGITDCCPGRHSAATARLTSAASTAAAEGIRQDPAGADPHPCPEPGGRRTAEPRPARPAHRDAAGPAHASTKQWRPRLTNPHCHLAEGGVARLGASGSRPPAGDAGLAVRSAAAPPQPCGSRGCRPGHRAPPRRHEDAARARCPAARARLAPRWASPCRDSLPVSSVNAAQKSRPLRSSAAAPRA